MHCFLACPQLCQARAVEIGVARSEAGESEAERKKREAEEKEAEKVRKREEKKAEQRAAREAQKNDPVYKAKDFAARLNKDSGECFSLARRLHAAIGPLAKDLVAALEQDGANLDECYKELNDHIDSKDLDNIKKTMESAAADVRTYQKHERLARSQIAATEKDKDEKDSGKKTK
jgi:hypothetical protein